MPLEPFHQGRIVNALLSIRIPYRLVPLAVFGVYWIVPGLFLAISAVLASRPPAPIIILYSGDITHLAFSLLISAGSLPVYFIVKKTSPIVRHTLGVVRGATDHAALRARYRTYQTAAFGRWIIGGCLLISLAVFATLLGRAFDSHYAHWWGHISHGFAGLYFALIAAQMAFWGTWSFFVVAAVALLVARIAGCGFIYEPLQPDGCNGLRPVGLLVMAMWAYSLMAALAIFIVFSRGYLDLENNPSVWFISISASLCLPLVAILPLVSLTNAIRHARERYLVGFETLTRASSPARSHRDVETLSQIVGLAESVRRGNIFPFRSQAVLVFSVLNAIQITLSLSELLRR